MTREEQIIEAGVYHSCGWRPPKTCGHNMHELAYISRNLVFEAGAKWADEHPDKRKVYTKDELYKMGFAFDTNGNIADPRRDAEMWDRYVEYKQGKWLDKVCKYITPILKTYCSDECAQELIEGLKNKLGGDL